MALYYQVSDVKFVGVNTGTPVCPPRMKKNEDQTSHL